MQAYGLKSILEDMGYNIVFVDFHPGKCVIAPKTSNKIVRKLYKAIEIIKIHASFRDKIKFLKYKKNYARNYFYYLGIDKEYNYHPEIDVLIIGSDEVFNCVQDNINVGYSRELFGEGCQTGILMSYAASFGNTTLRRLKQYGLEEEIASYLKEFDVLSVRDKNSYEIVKKLIGCEPNIHLDPVLVYDYMNKCPYVCRKAESYANYLLIYGYSGRFTKRECSKIRAYAKGKDLKILCIGGIQDCCDEFVECSPFEIFDYFQQAYSVITDTFHGTIFSIVTHQKFGTIIRESGYGNAEKILDLLERLNLRSQVIQNIENLAAIIESPISYDYIENIIVQERKRSHDYLKVMIEDGVKNE